MATDLLRGFTNPVTGETFRFLSFTEEASISQWTVQPNGYVPLEHIHINQDEIFTVSKGELRVLINGKEHIAKAGDTITVPKGMRHIAFNNKPELLECIVEYRPGLDTLKFFQCFGGLTLDKDYDSKGKINIPKMCYFTKKMNARCIARPTSIPAPAFKLALNFFYVVGTIDKDYDEDLLGEDHFIILKRIGTNLSEYNYYNHVSDPSMMEATEIVGGLLSDDLGDI